MNMVDIITPFNKYGMINTPLKKFIYLNLPLTKIARMKANINWGMATIMHHKQFLNNCRYCGSVKILAYFPSPTHLGGFTPL